LTLTGVTLLFAMAQSNGTLSQLTHHAVRVCRGNAGTIPVMFFVLGALLSSMGPGNIATAALLAPIAMATAVRARIPLFLMAIMVGNGANAGALSPFAPTGIIVNGIMAKNGLPGHETEAYLYNLAAHALMAFAGYALFGGLRLFAAERTAEVVDPEGGRAFNRRQWITLGVIAALLISVLVLGTHVGLAAFVAAVLLVAANAADDGEAIKLMPWRVIIMVTGVTVLIALVERFQGIGLLVSLVARISTAGTVTGIVALLTGIVSVYSSTSGVVLPAFLPLAPGLAASLPGASAVGIAMSMNIGGHLVDVSPLSTIGALCIAGAGTGDTRRLFNQLLAWGLSMAVAGALLCYVLF
jgi:di/tricarboxylate transporter